MYSIEKIIRTGNGFKERKHVKNFKTFDAMYSFINKQDNNNWKASTVFTKSGVYAFAGGQWHNVKTLDPSILNHI